MILDTIITHNPWCQKIQQRYAKIFINNSYKNGVLNEPSHNK